jgi:hypothetical protein
MLICTNLMKFKFKCIKRSRFKKLFSLDLLESTLVFYIFVLDFSKNLKISNFEFKNHRLLISDWTDPAEFW